MTVHGGGQVRVCLKSQGCDTRKWVSTVVVRVGFAVMSAATGLEAVGGRCTAGQQLAEDFDHPGEGRKQRQRR